MTNLLLLPAQVTNKLSATEAWSFVDDEPDSILSFFRKREFYNISEGKVQILNGKPLVPTAQPPVLSNQESEKTCSSHAVGKAIVNIFDGFNYDTDQKEIIEFLKNTVQPKGKPAHLKDFMGKSVLVNFWRTGMQSSCQAVEVKVIIQTETVNKNWNGPKLKKEDLKKQHMSMVATWDMGKRKHHAIYVDQCFPNDPRNKNSFIFECINSWGEKDKEPKLKTEDIYQLHYISLFTVSQLVVSGNGESAKKYSHAFGLYEQVFDESDDVLFRQKNSDISQKKDKKNTLYKTPDNYAIGKYGSKPCFENTSKNASFYIITKNGRCPVPLNNWTYFGKSVLSLDIS